MNLSPTKKLNEPNHLLIMKNITFILLAFALMLMGVACDTPAEEQAGAAITADKKLDLNANRGNAGQHLVMDRFSAQGLDLDIEAMQTIVVERAQAESEDAMVAMQINQSLMTAQKETQVLDVNFSMSEEAVANGMFVFSIESPDTKELILELYDEEGYNLAANNSFGVNEGNNYKALNVSSLEDGEYLFRLKDNEGRELARTVNIEAAEMETYQ